MKKNAFVVGWLKNGPKGVILDSLVDATKVVDEINKNIETIVSAYDKRKGSIKSPYENLVDFLNRKKKRFVSKEGWEKIDFEEKRMGVSRGKLREKIVCIETMLDIANK